MKSKYPSKFPARVEGRYKHFLDTLVSKTFCLPQLSCQYNSPRRFTAIFGVNKAISQEAVQVVHKITTFTFEDRYYWAEVALLYHRTQIPLIKHISLYADAEVLTGRGVINLDQYVTDFVEKVASKAPLLQTFTLALFTNYAIPQRYPPSWIKKLHQHFVSFARAWKSSGSPTLEKQIISQIFAQASHQYLPGRPRKRNTSVWTLKVYQA